MGTLGKPQVGNIAESTPTATLRAEIADLAAYVSLDQTFLTTEGRGVSAVHHLKLPPGAALNEVGVRYRSEVVLSSQTQGHRGPGSPGEVELAVGADRVVLSLREIPPGERIGFRIVYATELIQDERNHRTLKVPLCRVLTETKGVLCADVSVENLSEDLWATSSHTLRFQRQKGERLLLQAHETSFLRHPFTVTLIPKGGRLRPVLLTHRQKFMLGLQAPARTGSDTEVELVDQGLGLEGLVFPTGRPHLQASERKTLFGRCKRGGHLDIVGRWRGHPATWHTRLSPTETPNRGLPLLWARAYLKELEAQTPRDNRGTGELALAYHQLGVIRPGSKYAWLSQQPTAAPKARTTSGWPGAGGRSPPTQATRAPCPA